MKQEQLTLMTSPGLSQTKYTFGLAFGQGNKKKLLQTKKNTNRFQSLRSNHCYYYHNHSQVQSRLARLHWIVDCNHQELSQQGKS